MYAQCACAHLRIVRAERTMNKCCVEKLSHIKRMGWNVNKNNDEKKNWWCVLFLTLKIKIFFYVQKKTTNDDVNNRKK